MGSVVNLNYSITIHRLPSGILSKFLIMAVCLYSFIIVLPLTAKGQENTLADCAALQLRYIKTERAIKQKKLDKEKLEEVKSAGCSSLYSHCNFKFCQQIGELNSEATHVNIEQDNRTVTKETVAKLYQRLSAQQQRMINKQVKLEQDAGSFWRHFSIDGRHRRKPQTTPVKNTQAPTEQTPREAPPLMRPSRSHNPNNFYNPRFRNNASSTRNPDEIIPYQSDLPPTRRSSQSIAP